MKLLIENFETLYGEQKQRGLLVNQAATEGFVMIVNQTTQQPDLCTTNGKTGTARGGDKDQSEDREGLFGTM